MQQCPASRYDRLVADGLLPPVTWRARRPITHIPHDRSPTFAEELEEADPAWVITLGSEPLRALGLEPLSLGDYGVAVPATILGHKIRLIRFAHTRQQAGHGAAAPAWGQAYQRWAAGGGAAAARQAIAASR